MDAKLVTFGAVSALAVAATAATPFILSGWADDNFLYTKVPEGTGKIIMKGKTFHRAILSFKGYHLNDPSHKETFDPSQPRWEVLPNKSGKNYETRPALTRSFGLTWVGIPGMRDVYSYQFSWNEYRELDNGEQEIRHRDELTELFIANDFTYVMVLEGERTKDNLPVRVEFAVILRVTNPYKALFESNDWLTQLESYVLRQGRNFVGSFSFDDLRSETDKSAGEKEESFSKPVRGLTLCLPEEKDKDATEQQGTKGAFGITIQAANLTSIKLTGVAAEKNEELSVAAYAAERGAEALRIGAAAEADAARMKGDAQAHVIQVTGDARAHETKVTGQATAEATAALMAELGKDPELGKVVIMGEALKSPGDGKVIVVPSDVLDVAKQFAGKSRK